MRKSIIYCLIIFIVTCCKSNYNKSNVSFKYTKDSIFVNYKNSLDCPVFTKIENLTTKKLNFVQSKAQEIKTIAKFSLQKDDSISILKKYKFKHYYGYYEKIEEAYDTLFNYALPFPRGKTYKIIQGYNGDFTHNNDFSRYTIDFNLQVDDTIVTARDGVVIKVVDQHNKQGTTQKYKPYGNYILVHHKNNIFSQYVHLKQFGSLVKVGDTIKMHQPIALSGFTGLTTTPHLHFGVFKATNNGFVSIPTLIDSIQGKKYTKNKIVTND